jgi:stromal membrane-associated protein
MGTHVSRVKSVDLDAWTDEQLQSVLKWGNSRANKSVRGAIHRCRSPANRLCRYWEAKLASGHVPSEAYVEIDSMKAYVKYADR